MDENYIRRGEKAKAVADRRNKKNAKRWPLLAMIGEIEQVTGEDITRADVAWQQHWEDVTAKFEERAERYREGLKRVRPEVIAMLDAQWNDRTLGKSCEYHADFWHCAIRQYAPEIEQEVCG